METQKKEYLEKYLPKKNAAQQNNKPQLQVYDPEMDLPNHSSNSEDEVPLLYNPSGVVLSELQARTLLKKGALDADLMRNQAKNTPEIPKKSTSGTWVSITENPENRPKNQKLAEKNDKIEPNLEKNGSDESESDLSPGRRRHDSESEPDVETRLEEREEKAQEKLKRSYAAALGIDHDSDLSPQRKDEEKEDLEIENQRKLVKIAEQFKNAETVFRDDKGVKIDMTKKFEDKKAELLRRNQERILEWGTGVVQKQEKIERKNEEKKLKNEKFSNYEISKEREKELMGVDRFGDPMKPLIEKDKTVEKQAESIYIGLRKKCRFRGIPNRFGIEPGYRWDGVDRSNGYERKYLGSINRRKLDKESKEMEHLRDM